MNRTLMKTMPVKRINISIVALSLSLLVLMCPVQFAAAEEAASASDKSKQKMEEILKDSTFNKGSNSAPRVGAEVDDPARPKSLPAGVSDPETKRLFEKALQDYYVYRSQGLDHRSEVFKWQLFSAKMIFVIVLGLVICGIVFAGIQFRAGMRQAGLTGEKGENISTSVELSGSGVKISSPVLGVIILFLSLGFFYLYLVYVYPIENVF